MKELIIPVISYFWGGIPFGFLTGWWVKGVDIRKFGSGNIGATNVFRVIGKKWGIIVFILDFVKGFFPPLLAGMIFPEISRSIIIVTALASVCGHNWTPFLKFKGGKGVATSLGAISSLCFFFDNLGIAVLASLLVWIIVFFSFRYVSLASMLAGLTFLAIVLLVCQSLNIKVMSIVFFIFLLARHRSNINNMLSKKELRF